MIRVAAFLTAVFLIIGGTEGRVQAQGQGGFAIPNAGNGGAGGLPAGFNANQFGAQSGFGTNSFGNSGSLGSVNRVGTTGTSSNSGLSTANRNSSTTSRNSTSAFGTGTNGVANALGTGTGGLGQTGTGTQMGQQPGLLGDNSQSMLQPQQGGRNTGGGNNNQFGNLFQNQFRAQTAFGANPLFNGNNQQRRTGTGGQPSLRLGFQVPMRPAVEVEQGIESRLQAAAARPARGLELPADLDGVRIEVGNSGTVRLVGEVASDAAKRRAANVIRLEPGVKKVVNELTVAEATK